MRSIGVHRSDITTLASDTNSHDQDFAVQREKARQHVRDNMIKHNKVKKVGNLDSSQRTSIISSDLSRPTIERTAFALKDGNDVKAALSRVRNKGCVPPKKKNSK
jgi:hypothetical protein